MFLDVYIPLWSAFAVVFEEYFLYVFVGFVIISIVKFVRFIFVR